MAWQLDDGRFQWTALKTLEDADPKSTACASDSFFLNFAAIAESIAMNARSSSLNENPSIGFVLSRSCLAAISSLAAYSAQTWLCLAGQHVPAIYGPSGDVKWDEADPTYSLEAARRAVK